jgi:putative hemolysin
MSRPAEDKNRYNTLAGLLMYVLGQLPAKGQVIGVGDWRFQVIDLEGRRIDKVTAQIHAPATVITPPVR